MAEQRSKILKDTSDRHKGLKTAADRPFKNMNSIGSLLCLLGRHPKTFLCKRATSTNSCLQGSAWPGPWPFPSLTYFVPPWPLPPITQFLSISQTCQVLSQIWTIRQTQGHEWMVMQIYTVHLKVLTITLHAITQNCQAGPKKLWTSALLSQLKKHKQHWPKSPEG